VGGGGGVLGGGGGGGVWKDSGSRLLYLKGKGNREKVVKRVRPVCRERGGGYSA